MEHNQLFADSEAGFLRASSTMEDKVALGCVSSEPIQPLDINHKEAAATEMLPFKTAALRHRLDFNSLAQRNARFKSHSRRHVTSFCLLFCSSLTFFWGRLAAEYFHISVLPYRCPLCSVMSWMQWKWCQVDCCRLLGCLHHLLHLCKKHNGETMMLT